MKKFSLLFLVFLLSVGSILAQRTLTGTVADDTGEPLIGANVVVKGTSIGTITDIDGNFSLDVAADVSTLIVSFTGFETQEIDVTALSVIDIVLSQGELLDEVVVTSLGIKKEKRALGYAVTTIDKKLIQDRPEGDVSRILQGKIPGVNVTSTGGVSGSGTNMIIRGYSSMSGSNQPLWVVDGVPFNSGTNDQAGFTTGGSGASSRMLDLDPNNIENISVLKGLSATVLYGDQGRNGVVLVTTKTGSATAKKATIELTQSYFQNKIASLPVYQQNYGGGFQQITPDAWFFSTWGANFADITQVPHPIGVSTIPFLRDAFPEFAVDPSLPWGPGANSGNVVRYDNRAYEDPGTAFFRTGNQLQTSLNVSGGTDNSSYAASFAYSTEEGFTPGNTLDRINFGLGYNTALSKKLNLRSSFNYANTDIAQPPLNAGTGSNALNGIPSAFANVLYTPRNVDLANLPFEHPVDGSSVYYRGGNDIPNPRWLVKNHQNTDQTSRFFTTNQLTYSLNDNINFVYRMGLDTYSEQLENRYNKGVGRGGSAVLQSGAYISTNIRNTIWNHDVNLNFNKTLSEDLILTALIGGNYRHDKFDRVGLASTGQLARDLFNHRNFTTVSSTNPLSGQVLNRIEEQKRAGVYGSVTLDYKDFLFFNALARNDWTSTVEPENARILYPGASVSFIPSEVFDWTQSPVINYLKIRAGYGTSAGFPDPYQTRNILDQNPRGWLSGSNTVATQGISNRLGNPNLKPELHKEIEVGVEANMFRNKVKIDLSAYQRTSSDLITDAPLDPSTGFTTTTINVGAMRTRGLDLMMNFNPVNLENGFGWDLTWNFSLYRSVITELAEGLDRVQLGSGFTTLGNFAEVDDAYGVIYGSAISRFNADPNADWNPADPKIVQPTGRYLPTVGIERLGDPNPDYNTSLINTFRFKGLNLNFMWEYRHGGVIVSQTVKGVLARGLSADTEQLDRELSLVLEGVTADGSPNNIQITAANYFFDNYFFSNEAITFDGSTIRLREISLNYSLPQSLISSTPFTKAALTLSANNLWFKSLNFPTFVNFDTDVLSTGVGNGLGFDYLTGPSARRYGATLNLTF